MAESEQTQPTYSARGEWIRTQAKLLEGESSKHWPSFPTETKFVKTVKR